jgi:hypothetical protein
MTTLAILPVQSPAQRFGEDQGFPCSRTGPNTKAIGQFLTALFGQVKAKDDFGSKPTAAHDVLEPLTALVLQQRAAQARPQELARKAKRIAILTHPPFYSILARRASVSSCTRCGVLVLYAGPYGLCLAPIVRVPVGVGDVPLAVGGSMTYLFDFGDHWEFEVTQEGVDPPAAAPRRPELLDGRGEAPEQYPNWEGEEWE